MLFVFITRVVCQHLGNSQLDQLHLDIQSHLLGYSNKDPNSSAGIKPKLFVLLQNKKRESSYLLFYKHDYVGGVFVYFYNRVFLTCKLFRQSVSESWNSLTVRDLTWGLLQWDRSSLGLEFQVRIVEFKEILSIKSSMYKSYEIIKCLYKN